MMFEIFESGRGRFRYGYRDPETDKVAMMSQGAWTDRNKAIQVGRAVETAIVKVRTPALTAELDARRRQVEEGDRNLEGTRARIKDLVGEVQDQKAKAKAAREERDEFAREVTQLGGDNRLLLEAKHTLETSLEACKADHENVVDCNQALARERNKARRGRKVGFALSILLALALAYQLTGGQLHF